ncbi:ComEC/Rec2 family competence protein [Pseudoxanthomonas sp. 22568]|uniref:ComEC/Rec2 family competence protein n=1 Tax=Pseudoxanthomonas sp. 22568 TaxID=3453945 RepID=UPI003F87E2D0
MDYEIDFLPVGEGSGDAIVIRYGEAATGYWLHVIDGGRTETADTIVDHIDAFYPGYHINHMVVTHADNDHACGLVGVMKKKRVEHLWMNRPWLYASEVLHHFHGNYTLQGLIDEIKSRHSYLVELEQLARAQGTQIHEVFQGDQIGKFTVLAPHKQRYIQSIPDFGKTPDRYSTQANDLRRFGLMRALADSAMKLFESWDFETLASTTQTSASNESCVVQYANLDGKCVLLTADVGPIGLDEAATFGAQLGLQMPTFVQVPHHGSRHNVTPAVLDAWLGPKRPPGTVIGTAFCSVGANKHDYPRRQVTNAFMRRGFKVYATRTGWLSHSHGGGHPNAVPAVAEAFSFEVEGVS